MDAVQAKARLTILTAAASDPVLTSAELDELVLMGRRADSAGRVITGTGWIPTFDLNAAAAIGWTWKAGKAASDVTFNTDGQGFSMSHLIAHCERMAKGYQGRTAYSIHLTSGMTVVNQEV